MRDNEFVTADTHFGHGAVIGYTGRPFSCSEEMDEVLIERWNAKVPVGSIVYHLGDFALARKERVHELLFRLNGTIRLVKGNHDRVIKGDTVTAFDWVRDYYESKTTTGIRVCMSHYPMVTWNGSHYGSWMLHGHSHGVLPDAGIRRLDVGIDTHPNLEPYNFDELLTRMQGRKSGAFDSTPTLTAQR